MHRLEGQFKRIAAAGLMLALFHCGGTSTGSGDAGDIPPPDAGDAGSDAGDAGGSLDAGTDAGSDAGNPDAGADAGNPDAGDAGPALPTDGSGTIAADAGGILTLDGGPTLVIPVGALAADTIITISQLPEKIAGAFTPIYDFAPEATTFSSPFPQVTIPIPPGTPQPVSIYFTRPGSTTAYDTLPTGIRIGGPSAILHHLGQGFVGPFCTQGAACTSVPACHAGAFACSSGTPVCADSGPLPDGTSCGTGLICTAGACGPPPTRTVTGSFHAFFAHDDGSFTEGPDNTAFVAPDSLLFANGAGGTTSVAITLDQNGDFTVPNVPFGTYYLRTTTGTSIPNGTVFGSTATTGVTLTPLTTGNPDLTFVVHGRADAKAPTQPTPVTLTLNGLDPWERTGIFDHIYMGSAGARVDELVPGSQEPAVGSTSATVTFDWKSSNIFSLNWLPDAAAGDTTVFVQRHHVSLDNGGSASVSTRFAKSTDFTVVDGTGASATLTMQAAPLSSTLPTAGAFSQFAALVPVMNPAASVQPDPSGLTFPSSQVSLFGVPGSIAYPDTSLSVDGEIAHEGLYAYTGALDTDVDYGPLSFGGFLGAPYQEYRQFTYSAGLVLTADGNSTGLSPTFVQLTPVDQAGPTIAPVLSPVRSPLIGGQDAFAPQTGVGLTPTFSWTPPALGSPTAYAITIQMISPSNDPDEIGIINISSFTGTSFTLPDGLLISGRAYAAIITAVQMPGQDVNRPNRVGLPELTTDAVTNIFRP
jgi:hypothetical protein